MIQIKSQREIELMREAGKIAANALVIAGRAAENGVTTYELDRIIHDAIVECGAQPTFLGYAGFPGSACISIDDEVIHGIPSTRKIRSGELVKVDVGATYQGYVGDCANTFIIGEVSDDVKKLVEVTRQSFFEGIKHARVGNRISDISHAIQCYVEANGFSVVRRFVGHGIGSKLHEPPEIPNFGEPGTGASLSAGMTLAIEPMVNQGTFDIKVLSDGWTVKTKDGLLSSHYENTVLITDGEPEILTLADEVL